MEVQEKISTLQSIIALRSPYCTFYLKMLSDIQIWETNYLIHMLDCYEINSFCSDC